MTSATRAEREGADDPRGGEATVPLASIVALLRRVGAELAAMHARGEVHGGVSPSAISVGADGSAAALAPPVARRGPPASSAYLAPEQRHDHRLVDGRADQYALALIAYELLSGREREEAVASARALAEIHDVQFVPGRPLRPDIRAGANDVLRRALSRDPDHRYPSMREFVAALCAECVAGPPPAPGRATRRVVDPAGLLVVAGTGVVTAAILLLLLTGRDMGTSMADRAGRGRASLARLLDGTVGAASAAGDRGAPEIRVVVSGAPTAGRVSAASAGLVPRGGIVVHRESGAPGAGAPGTLATPTVVGTPVTVTLPSLQASPRRAAAAAPARGTARVGFVRVVANAGAPLVVVDGVPRGPAPALVRVTPGPHAIAVRGVTPYAPASARIDAVAGDTTRVAFARRP